VPWHSYVAAPALLKAPKTVGLYAVTGARLTHIVFDHGVPVSAGQKLFVLESPDLDGQRAKVAARLTSLRYQLEAIGFDATFREQTGVLRQEVAAEVAENAGIDVQKERLVITAPFDGILTDILPDLHPGDWISPKDRLATVKAGDGEATIDAYVGEEDLSRIDEGDTALFLPEATGRDSLPCRVIGIDRSPVRVLTDPEVAKPYGGGIAVRGKENALVPEGATYRVHLAASTDPVSSQLRGRVRIQGRAESLITRGVRAAVIVILREWGA